MVKAKWDHSHVHPSSIILHFDTSVNLSVPYVYPWMDQTPTGMDYCLFLLLKMLLILCWFVCDLLLVIWPTSLVGLIPRFGLDDDWFPRSGLRHTLDHFLSLSLPKTYPIIIRNHPFSYFFLCPFGYRDIILSFL